MVLEDNTVLFTERRLSVWLAAISQGNDTPIECSAKLPASGFGY